MEEALWAEMQRGGVAAGDAHKHSFRGVRCLVTGATGFVGGAIARALVRLQANVLGVGRNEAVGHQLECEGVSFARVDLTDAHDVAAVCRGMDVVFHCAALCEPFGEWADFVACNVTATEHVIAGCVEHDVGRLVHVSSSSFLPFREGVKESDELPRVADVDVFYPKTKLMAEHVVRRAVRDHGLPAIILRPRLIYGPGDRTVMPNIMGKIVAGRLRVIGDGGTRTEMCFIDNLVDAMLLCVHAGEQCLGRTYHITDGTPVELWPLLRRLSDEVGHSIAERASVPTTVAYAAAWAAEWAYWLNPFTRSAPPLTRYTVRALTNTITMDITAAREDLLYNPLITTERGMRVFLDWWKAENHIVDIDDSDSDGDSDGGVPELVPRDAEP